jgi:hypothetical protein
MIYGRSRTHSGRLSTLSVDRVMPDDISRPVVTEWVGHIVLNNSLNLEFILKQNARMGVNKIASDHPGHVILDGLFIFVPGETLSNLPPTCPFKFRRRNGFR